MSLTATAFIVALGLTSYQAASADDGSAPINTAVPTIAGTAQYGLVLRSSAGSWNPDGVNVSRQWLRDGTPIQDAKGATYTIGLADIGKHLSVREAASLSGAPVGIAESFRTAAVSKAPIVNTKRPVISGTRKFRKTLKTTTGTWSVGRTTFSYQWYRNGSAIAGAVKWSHLLAPADVEKKISVRVTASKPGHTSTQAHSNKTGTIAHLKPVKKTVTYRIVTKGKVTASLSAFRAAAKATLNDPRGWRGMGVAFKEVKKGGSFSLVLSQASKVPSYSSGCSRTYSCRVGRYVIINQTRWLHATSTWRSDMGLLRDYRHMVINHEVGHWLGHNHSRCGGKGRLAPVMMQQSKGLHGCKINPWPKTGELSSSRFHIKKP